ncbi:MAG: hypothetical protein L0H55_08460, partial [Candidatus Nitrosocosmicus sp.]|nr:hypothetical protein [Candidatus Nitrosocosmicus sp.]
PKQIEGKDEDYRREIRLFRDILRFIITIDKRNEDEEEFTEYCELDGCHFKELFKPRILINWLLINNVDLRNEFAGQPYTKDYRAHKISSRISTRLEKLTELGVLSIHDKKVESGRNNEMTYRYLVKTNGMIIASMLNLQNYKSDSYEYKKILKFIFNRFVEIIPNPYKTSSNFYFHFLKEILDNCIGNHQDTLYYFFDLVVESRYNLLINFSELRYKINNMIYKKIIKDTEFRSLFYKSMYEFKTPLWLLLLQYNDTTTDDSLLKQEKKEALQLVKMQFKLDIESQIDKDILEVLNTNNLLIKSFQYRRKQDVTPVTNKEVLEGDEIERIQEEHVIDFNLRIEWEKERNSNLSNTDRIVLVVKCIGCGHLYPYPFGIEKESFSEISCVFCKGYAIRPHNVKNSLDHLFVNPIKKE